MIKLYLEKLNLMAFIRAGVLYLILEIVDFKKMLN